METTLQRARKAAGRALTLAEVAALPVTKADRAHEAEERKEACERARRKGNRARDLLDSPDCNLDPATVAAWINDFRKVTK